MILGLLIPLLFLAILVVVARKLFSKDTQGAPSTFSIRRLFQYALLFGLLVVSVSGIAGLIGRLFDSGQVIAESRTDLARDITFTIIGVPLYLLVGRWTKRTLNADPSERHSFAWNSYLTVVSITALATTLTSAYSVLSWALDSEPFSGLQLARVLVWGLVWIVHWQMIETASREDEFRVHVIAGSLIGLSTLSFGVGLLIASVARLSIEDNEKSLLVQDGNPSIQALNLIILGMPVWYHYWLKHGINLKRELFWYSYVLLAGVAGGFLTLTISGSVVIYDALVWYIGDATELIASRHFNSSAGALGSAIVGISTWWYHARVVNSEIGGRPSAIRSRDEIRRVYEYLISGISLIAASAGLMMIIVAILESVTPGEVVSTSSSTNTLMLAITLILVGAPIWYSFWSRIESHVIAGGEEQSSPTRRIFLLMLFGVSAIAAVISVLAGVFIFLDDLLNNQLSGETVREMRFAVAILLANAAIGWYHWSIYRQEREVTVRKARPDKFIVLMGPKDENLANALHREFGGHIQFWQPYDADFAETGGKTDGKFSSQLGSKGNVASDGEVMWDQRKVIDLIQSTSSQDVMIIKEKRGLKLVPFSRSK